MAREQHRQAPAASKAQRSADAPPAGATKDSARVAERAYEIWQQSGRPQGRDQEHWFQAERELRAGKSHR